MAQQNEEAGPSFSSNPEKAGTVIRIRVENFMCHSSLSIDFIDHVNFITGQNGSGKSAILTALCVAFGIKARGTQRATSLKDFIKNGCSQALVVVEIKNEGADSFKPDDYGRKIIIERKITESGNTSVLKDSQGKKIASKKEELQELVDHFNIDVENPCVIMTQDKSREFLHAGSGKEKFKFFFKATLLQQVSDLHKHVQSNIEAAYAIVREMEQELQPQIEMHKQLEEKLQTVERVESMSQRVGILDNLHAWSEVHDVDYNLKQASIKLEKYKIRIPTCEDKIRRSKEALEKHRAEHTAKKETISSMLQKTEELRHKQDELQHKLSQATKEKVQLDEEHNSRRRAIQQMMERVQWLQRQIVDIRERHVQASQAEEHEREESFRKLQAVIDEANEEIKRLKQEESQLEIKVNMTSEEMRKIREELEEKQREHRDLQGQIRRLQNQRVNKVTAFGGETILRLLQAIEKHHAEFTKPPLGPIGAHVALIGDDSWALALEVAIGKLLNAFVVTNHKDLLLLRDCAKSCGHENLQIIIYDFVRPLLNIPPHMVPDRSLVTVMSVLCTEIPTIMNVLVDQGSVERQVLVKDYDMGKKVIFEGRNPNVKEAYTMDGTRMFARGGSQTTLPPDSRIRSGRLSAAVDDQITHVEEELSRISQEIRSMESRKRSFDGNLVAFKEETHYFKRRRIELERHVTTKQLCLRDLKSSAQAEALDKDPDVDELEQEILRLQSEIQSKEDLLEKLKIRIAQAQEKTTAARSSLDALCESARGDIEALQEAENSLVSIEEEMAQAANGEAHFTKIMQDRIIPDIRNQEAEVERLTKKREELAAKAAEKCSEEEASGLDGSEWSTEQIRKERAWLQEKLRHEERRNEESGDQLRSKSRKLKQRIEIKQNQYSFYKLKLDMVQKALELRKTKFDRNTSLLKRQLHWQFNSHLRKKGMSGKIQVDLASETLSIQVQMPQDSSNNLVRDTRGLSGGERSFSTLCFALALHEMTEAPFRAMDEFDVFMDAVSRKISLDTVVDFAVAHGSQWIFITPHDISMVKAGPRVKKQQMAAPRP